MPRIAAPTRRRLLFALAAVSLLIIGHQLGSWFTLGRQQLTGGEWLQSPGHLPSFHLIDHNGQPFGLPELAGHWNLFVTGQIDAPGCDPMLRHLVEVRNRLAHRPEQAQFRVIMLLTGIDPQTTKNVKQYIGFYSPDFVALYGTVSALAETLGFAADDRAELTSCGMAARRIAVVSPAGEMLAILDGNQPASVIAGDLETLFDN